MPSKAGTISVPFCPQHWEIYCLLRRERLPGLDLTAAVGIPDFAAELSDDLPEVAARVAVKGTQAMPAWFSDRGRAARRTLVIQMYGGRCACCGEDDAIQLDIDHAHGGGNRERELGIDVLQDAVEHAGDGKYRLLCVSCHRAVTRRGKCKARERHISHAGVERGAMDGRSTKARKGA